MSAETPRDIMAQADRVRARARALDDITTSMRLHTGVPVRKGKHFFFRSRDAGDRDVHLTPTEDQLFYEWAMTKMREYEREADQLDAKLKVVDE